MEENLTLQDKWFEDYVKNAEQNYQIAKTVRILIYKFSLKIQDVFFQCDHEKSHSKFTILTLISFVMNSLNQSSYSIKAPVLKWFCNK